MKYEEFGGLTIFLLKILGKFRGKNLIFEMFEGGGVPTIYFLKNLGNFRCNFIILEMFGGLSSKWVHP